MSDWCPENDGAYRAEVAEIERRMIAGRDAEITRLRAALAAAEAERDRQHDFATKQIARNADLEAELTRTKEENERLQNANKLSLKAFAEKCVEIERLRKALTKEKKL